MSARTIRTSAVALAACVALVAPASPAGAATVSDPLLEGLAGPLGLAVGDDGSLYVTQSFAGLITTLDKKGDQSTVDVGGFPTGVAAEGRGTFSFTLSGPPPQGVHRMLPNGKHKFLGDTSTLEFTKNPDGNVMYGFQGLPDACADLFPDEAPASHPGDVNPNAYALAILPDGSRVVADAGGNTLVRVAANGAVRLLAILPPVPVTVSAIAAQGAGFPECAAGYTYLLHPVPTDVELGPDGMLYVSSLPGGPEDPVGAASLGSPGGVFRVDPRSGATTRVASGFLGAVDLAVADDGTIYVAELYADRISKVVGSGAAPVVDLPSPGAVEWNDGMLYATTGVFGSGGVVTITP
jgi:hypothetical protein